ncbi:MAG: bifunctional metallophosphatase/5'-nucleotidase [Bacteroidales bacterium]|nr:bifunctional metallophosphatase/5'-nucleotidase [Bacteroidales bacterium]
MKIQNFLVWILLAGIAIIPAGTFGQAASKETEIIILHTNDMHAKIDNMGKLAYLADSLRKIHPFVFLFAAGDNFTGNPVVDMVEDKGFPMIDLMNQCGFNLSALGNHEFDLGQDKLNARIKQAAFPFISCNIDASNAVFKQPEPFYILEAGGIRIPVLGVIQLGENGLPDSHPSKLEGLRFTDGLQQALKYKYLKQEYGMLIGLTHLGVETDEPLAKEMPEFDVIIGGHSHTTMTKAMMVNDVMIVQAGSGLRNVGKLTLGIVDGKINRRDYELIPLQSVTNSKPEVQALIDQYNDNKELNVIIGFAEKPIAGEDELGSLMTDAITSQLKLDIAFQNTGGIRISSIPEGEIRLKDVYKLDPFGNLIVIYKMNVDEMTSLICNAYNREKSIDLEVSGITYEVILDEKGSCVGVEMKDMNGKILDPVKDYSVGLNSYISASYKFDHRDPGNSTFTTGAQTLIDFIKEKKTLNYSGVKRVGLKK